MTDIFKLNLQQIEEEMGWHWGKKLVKAKKGDVINICGIKCKVVDIFD